MLPLPLPLGQLQLLPLVGGHVIGHAPGLLGRIDLLYIVPGEIVGIEIPLPGAQSGASFIMGVPEVHRHAHKSALFRVGGGLFQRHGHAVALGALAHGDDGLGHGHPGLRQSHHLKGLPGADGLQKRQGIGQPHILAGVHDHPPHDEPGIHPSVEEPGAPGQRRVGIRAPQGFTKRGEHVVIQRLVHLHGGPLYGLLGHLQRHVHLAVCVHRRGHHRQLQGV